MFIHKVLALSVTYLLSGSFLYAQDFTYSEEDVITIGMTLSFQSEILSEERKILISLPDNYSSSSTHYPVIYLLDPLDFYQFNYTSSVIGALSEIDMIPQMILVGIHSENRLKDMNTATSVSEGGADKFIDFLNNELQIFIQQKYRTEPYSVLIGHSFSGLFALHTLVHAPDSFNAYIAISPSVWWEDGKLVKELKLALDEGTEFNNNVYTTMANETDRTLSNYESFLDVMSEGRPDGLSFSNMYLKDESHVSTPMRSIYYGIQSIYENWVPPDSISSMDSLMSHYEHLSEHYSYAVNIPVEAIRKVGIELLEVGNCPESLRVLEFNTRTNATEAITYNDMAWGLRRCDKLGESLPYFEKAVEVGRVTNSDSLSYFIETRDETAQLIAETEE